MQLFLSLQLNFPLLNNKMYVNKKYNYSCIFKIKQLQQVFRKSNLYKFFIKHKHNMHYHKKDLLKKSILKYLLSKMKEAL